MEVRVSQVRKAFMSKLEEGNERLAMLGRTVHDLSVTTVPPPPSALEPPPGAVGVGTPVLSRKRETVAQHLNIADSDDDDDSNYAVLRTMGLLSKKRDSNAAAHAPTTRDRKPPRDQTAELADLLDTLERAQVDTHVTVDDPIQWTAAGDETFTDFGMDFQTDESFFPSQSAHVRRSYDDMVWLHDALEQELGMPLTDPLPPPDADLPAYAEYLTALVNDPACQHTRALEDFFFAERHLLADRPTSFTTDLNELDRSDLASLPMMHLNAICKYYNLNTRNCETRFEFTDLILAHHEGREAEFGYDEQAGEGFKARKKVEEDLFNQLAVTRAKEGPKEPSPALSRASLPGATIESTPTPAEPVPEGPITLPITVATFLESSGLARFVFFLKKNK